MPFINRNFFAIQASLIALSIVTFFITLKLTGKQKIG